MSAVQLLLRGGQAGAERGPRSPFAAGSARRVPGLPGQCAAEPHSTLAPVALVQEGS